MLSKDFRRCGKGITPANQGYAYQCCTGTAAIPQTTTRPWSPSAHDERRELPWVGKLIDKVLSTSEADLAHCEATAVCSPYFVTDKSLSTKKRYVGYSPCCWALQTRMKALSGSGVSIQAFSNPEPDPSPNLAASIQSLASETADDAKLLMASAKRSSASEVCLVRLCFSPHHAPFHAVLPCASSCMPIVIRGDSAMTSWTASAVLDSLIWDHRC